MNNYDLYQARLQDSGKLSKDKHISNKIRTFQRALDRSYNSVRVQLNEKRIQALITGIPTSPVITKKNFATLKSHNCEVGDTILWEDDNSYWIIVEHDSTEPAVFQGSIQKCLYEIFWRDPVTNEEYSAHVAAKGPEETTITNGVKHSIFFDRLTDSLYLIVPQKTPGAHLLTRYFQLMVNGKKWEIEISDNMTRRELLYIDLKEVVKDRDTDGEKFVDEQKDLDLYLRTSLDDIQEIELNSTARLQSFILKEGEIIARDGFEYQVKNATIKDAEIVFDEKGLVEITIIHKDLKIRKRLTISVGDTTIVEPQIIGADIGRTLTKETFKLNVSKKGKWSYDKTMFDLIVEGQDFIELKLKNKTGNTKITFSFDDTTLEKEIKIIPLFGGV